MQDLLGCWMGAATHTLLQDRLRSEHLLVNNTCVDLPVCPTCSLQSCTKVKAKLSLFSTPDTQAQLDSKTVQSCLWGEIWQLFLLWLLLSYFFSCYLCLALQQNSTSTQWYLTKMRGLFVVLCLFLLMFCAGEQLSAACTWYVIFIHIWIYEWVIYNMNLILYFNDIFTDWLVKTICLFISTMN